MNTDKTRPGDNNRTSQTNIMKPQHLLLFLAVFTTASLTAFADWPQYHGPNHDNTASEELATKKFPADGPKVLWRKPMTAGFSSFAVAGGHAFTQVLRNVDGLDQEVVVALDAMTGDEIWAQTIGLKKYEGGGDSGANGNKGGDGPRSTPSIDGSSELALTCFNAADGKEIWKKNFLKEFNGKNISWKNAASPIIYGDHIFAVGGGKNQALLAFNKSDGSIAWKGESDVMTHATPIVAEIRGQRQVIFFTQEGLVSLVPDTGEVLWRQDFPYKTSTAASPVVSGSMVYCSAGYGVGAAVYLISKTGDKWSSEEMWFSRGNKPIVNHWSTPVQRNGFLYGMFGFKDYADGPVKCIDMATGKIMWEKEGFGPGNIILSGDTLIALGDAGQLVLIDTNVREYTELARAKVIDGKCWSTPVLSNGRIYLRSTTEGVCIDMSGK